MADTPRTVRMLTWTVGHKDPQIVGALKVTRMGSIVVNTEGGARTVENNEHILDIVNGLEDGELVMFSMGSASVEFTPRGHV